MFSPIRLACVVACLVLVATFAGADEPPAYKKLQSEVDALKSRVSALEQKVNTPAYAARAKADPACECVYRAAFAAAPAGACVCQDGCVCAPDGTPVRAVSASDAAEYVRVCTGDKCYLVKRATVDAAAPEFMTMAPGAGCAACGPNATVGASAGGAVGANVGAGCAGGIGAGSGHRFPVVHALTHPFEGLRARLSERRGAGGKRCGSCGG